MSKSEPFHVHLKASNQNLVYGYPGLSDTLPRIMGVLEIRTRDGSPFTIISIHAEINTKQSVSVSETIFTSKEAEKTTQAFSRLVYNNSSMAKPILGLDVPFLIPLPSTIQTSVKNEAWGFRTDNYLSFKLVYNKAREVSYWDFLVPIKRFDTLPALPVFAKPIVGSFASWDGKYNVEYSIPYQSFSWDDEIIVYIRVAAIGTGSSKLKLRRIQLELKEAVEVYQTGFPIKQKTVITAVKEFDGEAGRLQGSGVSCKLQLNLERYDIPSEKQINSAGLAATTSPIINQRLSPNTHSPLNSMTRVNTTIKDNVPIGLPSSHIRSFSIEGGLFSLRHSLNFKIKVSRGKDSTYSQDIYICPFKTSDADLIYRAVQSERLKVPERYRKMTLSQLSETMLQKPIIYNTNSVHDWEKLGLSKRTLGGTGKYLSHVLD
ncbi:BA75_04322T0 [Komagataella pastoris]|uniref:BA75_04322T0 n=1 Tax=Komagataella pastoris TaxID=4922 RepID=A0A1B2JG18_PICPA|nr:BA75_04322T0 [Komagataella pastoris]